MNKKRIVEFKLIGGAFEGKKFIKIELVGTTKIIRFLPFFFFFKQIYLKKLLKKKQVYEMVIVHET
jgi:hypothetical protein